MARHDGPVKGTLALVNTETAESTVIIVEPITTSTAQYTALEGGTTEVTTGTLITDGLEHDYFEASITTTGGASTTGARQIGATKGLLVFNNTTDAVCSSYIVEPLQCTDAQYTAILAGTGNIMCTMYTDTLGNMFFEAEAL